MDALRRHLDERFIRTYRDVLRRHVGDAGSERTDRDLDQEMRRLLARARELGFVTDLGILSFILVGVREAPFFYAHEPFRQLLTDSSVPEDGRIASLFEQASAVDWKAAAGRFAD